MRLTIENLSFRYGGRGVLHEISFTAEEGELLAILGPNGVRISSVPRPLSNGICFMSSSLAALTSSGLRVLMS